MDRFIKTTGSYTGGHQGMEGAWFALATLTLATWSLMIFSWARHLLGSRALVAPALRTAGISALARGGGRRVQKTSLPCCSHPCASRRAANSSCGCVQDGAINFYINYNCSSASTVKIQNGRREAAKVSMSGREQSRYFTAGSKYSHGVNSRENSLHSEPNSTPADDKFSTYDIVSSSEIRETLTSD